MKNLKKCLVASTLLLISFALFANDETLKSGLTLEGVLTCTEKIVPNERIIIYSDDEVVDVIYSDDIGNFNTTLEFDKKYVLLVGKEKYAMKWIEISTEIPVKYRQENHKVLFYINLEPVKILYTSAE